MVISAHDLTLVAAGGAAGSVLRWGIAEGSAGLVTSFPWPTLLINVVGAGALGLVAGRAERRADRDLYLAAGVGGVSGFTAFSAFSVEAVRLAETHLVSAVYLVLTVVLSVVLAGVGRVLGAGSAGPVTPGTTLDPDSSPDASPDSSHPSSSDSSTA